jgi:hypothetical protein
VLVLLDAQDNVHNLILILFIGCSSSFLKRHPHHCWTLFQCSERYASAHPVATQCRSGPPHLAIHSLALTVFLRAMTSFSRLVLSCALVQEAYAAFKLQTRQQQRQKQVDASDSGTDINKCMQTDPVSAAARQHHLKFWLLLGLYSYAEPLADSTVGRLPLYGIVKIIFTGAIAAPNSALRSYLYSYLQAHLLRADTLIQRHSSSLIRSVSYVSHRCLLTIVGFIMRQTVTQLSDEQLDDVQQRAMVLTREVKREKIARLQESIQGLDIKVEESDAESRSAAHARIASREWTAEETGMLQTAGSPRRASPRHTAAIEEGQENFDPLDGTCATVTISHADVPAESSSHSFTLTSPPRKADLVSPFRGHQRTPSRGLHATPAKAGSILSHRLGVLEEHGNTISALRERTHTPQKVVHFEAAAAGDSAESKAALKKKRQTFGL